MTPAQRLEAVSHALFGFWSPNMLGEALGVSERTVRRWRVGEFDIPEGVWRDCRKLCLERGRELYLMAGEIKG